MPLLKSKVYVINSLPLISSAGRASKRLSFIPFVKIAAERLSGVGPESLDKFITGDSVDNGIAHETVHGVEIALLRKEEATELDTAMLAHMKELLDDLPTKLGEPLSLFEWLRHTVTQASSRSVYGPLSPLQDWKTEENFWYVTSNRIVVRQLWGWHRLN
jgi:hypothetical protein